MYKAFKNWLDSNKIDNSNDIIGYLEIGNKNYNSSHSTNIDFAKDVEIFKQKLVNNKLSIDIKKEIDNLLKNSDQNLRSAVKIEFDIQNAMSLYYDFLTNSKSNDSQNTENFYDDIDRKCGGKNKIYYGAPGTGKSHIVSNNYPNYERVTFHPEYSYFDFIGGLRPVKREDESISYEFVPGIFIDVLVKTVNNKNEMNGIIIEELNRANTAAVFGDVFQLLDRDINGKSKYKIRNKDVCQYIKESTGKKCDYIYLPSNFEIIATMNSADQGVYVLDSAFKRRWLFEYVPIDFNQSDLNSLDIAGFEMKWAQFAPILNDYLTEIGVDEDRLIGQRFLNKLELNDKKLIASKLLIYLWDDVVRYNRHKLFRESKMFSKLIDSFNKDGIGCFEEELCNRLKLVKDEIN